MSKLLYVSANHQSSERLPIIAYTQFNMFGNVLDIRPAGENKIIVFEVPSSKYYSKGSDVVNVMSLKRQSADIAVIEDALAAHRAETGDENAALTDIHLTVRLTYQPTKNNDIKPNQAQLVRVGESEPKVIETEVLKAPVETKMTSPSTEDDLIFQKLLLTLIISQNHNSDKL